MNAVTTPTWHRILAEVQRHEPESVRAWFGDLSPGEMDRGVLEVRAHNEAQVRYLQAHCHAAFVSAAQAATGRLVTVRFAIAETPPTTQETRSPEITSNEDGGKTFELFAIGACNRLAQAAAVAAAEAEAPTYNPLFLHGPPGVGKTHLLHSIIKRAAEVRPASMGRYTTANEFMAQFTAALESDLLPSFRRRFREVDLLAVDDVRAFAGRERSQEELFHTLNALLSGGKQVVLAADRPPGAMTGLEERLASRFSAGLSVAMDPPCVETRLSILEIMARRRCIEVPPDALRQLAQRITSGGSQLEQALLRLDAKGQENSGRITMDMVSDVLR